MTPDLILPYEGVSPSIVSEPNHCGPGSAVIGAVTLGSGAWLGSESVIRADGQTVTVGAEFRLGARSTVHIATESHATIVGDRVVAGRNAVIHACTLGSDIVIEDDCVILDGSTVGDGVLIEAGSIVFPRSELEAGFVYAGSPAKKRGPASRAMLDERAARLRESVDDEAPSGQARPAVGETAYASSTAHLAGEVTLGAGATVFFSCRLEAAGGSIAIGADSNVQDNSVIRATGAGVVIGRETTIGHNVRMEDCRIGANSLIGIGCVLAPGTVVADDVLLAAGATTEPCQLIESGHLWGGRPARILGKLDDGKRAMMRAIIEGYCAHGRTYRQTEAEAG